MSPSRPPTRCSMRSPSIVCVSMIARSSGVSLPGLLMISFGIRTLPTSWRSAANSMSRRSRDVDAELVRDRERQVDDVAAVRARVRVVGLDHFAEKEHGPAVGVAQLQLGVDPNPPLAGEDDEQTDERQREHDGERRVDGRERDGEPDRREPGVDRVDPGHRAQLDLRRNAEHGPLAHGRARRSRTRTARRAPPGRSATGKATATLRPRGRARAPARRRATRSRSGARRAHGAAARGPRPRVCERRSRLQRRAAPSRREHESIGTRISWVGTAEPVPTSKSSRNEIA